MGTATGKGFLSGGHQVIFYDINEEKISQLQRVGLDGRHMDNLDPEESEIFFFTVSTPTEEGKINLRYLESAARNLGKKLKEKSEYCVVVVRSTVPPKTTEDLVAAVIEEESGRKRGDDFGLIMNPEYLREKNAEEDFAHPWIITIGSFDERSKEFVQDVYSGFSCPVHHLSLREAEIQKYIHNLYNAAKIAFFNEMRMVCEHIDVSPDKVFEIVMESAEASWNKKYGIRDFGPFDGMCLPKDTQAFLSWYEDRDIKLHALDGIIRSNKKFADFWKKKK